MIRNLLFCLFSLSLLSQFSLGSEDADTFGWANFSSQQEQAKYISNQLKKWNNKTSNLRDKPLRVIYFHAKDRKPLKNHLERWNGILSDIQNFFRTEMSRLGYNQVTISLEKENGVLKLHEIQGTQNEGN